MVEDLNLNITDIIKYNNKLSKNLDKLRVILCFLSINEKKFYFKKNIDIRIKIIFNFFKFLKENFLLLIGFFIRNCFLFFFNF